MQMQTALLSQASSKTTTDTELTANKKLYDRLVALQHKALAAIDAYHPVRCRFQP